MPLLSDPPVQWEFVEISAAPKSRWIWRKVLVSDALEIVSEEFADYGLAVCDALRRGFKPKRHHWSMVTRYGTKHYSPGESPVAIPDTADAGGFSPPAARQVERRRTARAPEAKG